MLVKLRVMQGAQAGREVIIPVAEFAIGRGEDCHLRPRSDAISRRHCIIAVNEGEVLLRDLGSKNGTYVNGQRVEGTRMLQSGDHLQVGPLQFELVVDHTLGGLKRPVPRDIKEVAARTAATPGESKDLDVSRWLEEGEDTDVSRAVATPETRQFRIDDTALGLNAETQVDREPEDHPSDEHAAADEHGTQTGRRGTKSSPGKLPPRPQAHSKDSRDAAADMLRRFFNRS